MQLDLARNDFSSIHTLKGALTLQRMTFFKPLCSTATGRSPLSYARRKAVSGRFFRGLYAPVHQFFG